MYCTVDLIGSQYFVSVVLCQMRGYLCDVGVKDKDRCAYIRLISPRKIDMHIIIVDKVDCYCTGRREEPRGIHGLDSSSCRGSCPSNNWHPSFEMRIMSNMRIPFLIRTGDKRQVVLFPLGSMKNERFRHSLCYGKNGRAGTIATLAKSASDEATRDMSFKVFT